MIDLTSCVCLSVCSSHSDGWPDGHTALNFGMEVGNMWSGTHSPVIFWLFSFKPGTLSFKRTCEKIGFFFRASRISLKVYMPVLAWQSSVLRATEAACGLEDGVLTWMQKWIRIKHIISAWVVRFEASWKSEESRVWQNRFVMENPPGWNFVQERAIHLDD